MAAPFTLNVTFLFVLTFLCQYSVPSGVLLDPVGLYEAIVIKIEELEDEVTSLQEELKDTDVNVKYLKGRVSRLYERLQVNNNTGKRLVTLNSCLYTSNFVNISNLNVLKGEWSSIYMYRNFNNLV